MANAITLQDISSRLDVLTAAILSNKNVLNIDEAAAFTGMTVSYLYKLTSTQEIPHYKPRGKMLYFDRAELESWLLQRRIKTMEEINTSAVNHVVGVQGGAK
jgi:excisionase family DNA binding protein